MMRDDIRPLENLEGVTHDLQGLLNEAMKKGGLRGVMSELSDIELERLSDLIGEEIDVSERAFSCLTSLQMWWRNRVEDVTHSHECRHNVRWNLQQEIINEMEVRGLVNVVRISVNFGTGLKTIHTSNGKGGLSDFNPDIDTPETLFDEGHVMVN